MEKSGPHWTFLSNYGHVLLALAKDPQLRIRDIAQRVGITERAVQKILVNLEEGGILAITKDGRRNLYSIKTDSPLRHPLESHKSIGDLIALIND